MLVYVTGLDDGAVLLRLVLRLHEAIRPPSAANFYWLQFMPKDLHEICSRRLLGVGRGGMGRDASIEPRLGDGRARCVEREQSAGACWHAVAAAV